jgi:FAD/FMN-containing dehydrogenase
MAGHVTTRDKVVEAAAVQEFQASLRGALVLPNDQGYEEARKVWNGMIDKQPAMIARCAGVADVVSAVNFARTHELPLAVRCGGHNVAGKATCDGGIVIDLSPMKGIRVDPKARTARAQGGVTWGEFDRETQLFGLATPGGVVSTTGIGGLTLGGGIGWLNGKFGLVCDNLLSADVVTADGQVVVASAKENEDLFWGLRGGGGNFGIVASFEYRVHPVGPVLAGLVGHPAAKAREVLQFYREFIHEAPDELTAHAFLLTAPPLPFVPEPIQGTPIAAVGLCYAGDLEEGARAVRPLLEYGPPAFAVVEPMPYTALQTMFDAGAPSGLLNYWKSGFLTELADDAINTLAARLPTIPSPLTQVLAEHVHGAAGRVGLQETAFAQRGADLNFGIFSIWENAAESERQIAWTRDFWGEMEPFTTGGVYVNYLGDEGDERVKAAYGPNYDRLAALKEKYDPANLFSQNQNIAPVR